MDPPFQGPDGDGYITIRDFEQYAVDRLTVLQAIDRVCGLEAYISDDDRKKAAINKVLVQQGLAMSNDLTLQEVIAKDQISHFILRLAFSRNASRREWLMKQEIRLFKFRLERSGGNGRSKLCPFPIITAEDMIKETPPHIANYLAQQQLRLGRSAIYKLPFEKAASLIARRRCAVWGGSAFVFEEDLDSIFVSEMREKLASSLEAVADSPLALTGAFEDLRISEFLNLLGTMNLNPVSSLDKVDVDKLSLSTLDSVYKRSFPPCMRWSMDHLKTNHHHKHWGRLQLRLFLKGCGMSFDEQVHLWQEEMKPKVDSEKFRKEHLYNIKHAYGLEGKRADYSPWACSKLLSGSAPPNPGPGECHGCPLKLFDAQPLSKMLNDWGIGRKTVDSMLELKRNGHFQLACVDYFRGTHSGSEGDGVGNHPNDFFRASMAYYKELAGEEEEKPKAVETTANPTDVSSVN
eukprot:GDKJ01028847.1.p1 GENE.GDKJ01028847.1~~GDKJ01028847.1.p1  ORF type:complete len:506 (-),score=109.46 GDKJ01028847.1:123-1508(-)